MTSPIEMYAIPCNRCGLRFVDRLIASAAAAYWKHMAEAHGGKGE